MTTQRERALAVQAALPAESMPETAPVRTRRRRGRRGLQMTAGARTGWHACRSCDLVVVVYMDTEAPAFRVCASCAPFWDALRHLTPCRTHTNAVDDTQEETETHGGA